jgi:hypothetical protein
MSCMRGVTELSKSANFDSNYCADCTSIKKVFSNIFFNFVSLTKISYQSVQKFYFKSIRFFRAIKPFIEKEGPKIFKSFYLYGVI